MKSVCFSVEISCILFITVLDQPEVQCTRNAVFQVDIFSYMSHLHPLSAKLGQQTALSMSSTKYPKRANNSETDQNFLLTLSSCRDLWKMSLLCIYFLSKLLIPFVLFSIFGLIYLSQIDKSTNLIAFQIPPKIHKYPPLWAAQQITLFAPEAQKPKTFRIAAFYAQKFSGQSARIHFSRHMQSSLATYQKSP